MLEILRLRISSVILRKHCLSLRLPQTQKTLYSLDKKLSLLLKSMVKYDFVSRISKGSTLLVGEGNLSFTVSIMRSHTNSQRIIASTFEKLEELSELGKRNMQKLKERGLQVLYELDATKLHNFFDRFSFDTIIFQFPNVASRSGIDWHNPNYILIRDFLVSATQVIKKDGSVLITSVNSEFYNNLFKFDDVAERAGFQRPIEYNFDPLDYAEYEHTMTHLEESALDDYDRFTTRKFILCNK